MHAKKLLHNFLGQSLKTVHKKRLNAVLKAVDGLIFGQKLTLTSVGRAIRNKAAKPKNNILSVDRLLGNKQLHGERKLFYKETAKYLIGTTQSPQIIVDWSDLYAKKHHILRAVVPFGKRGMVIYEEVHPNTSYNNHKVHTCFLDNLKSVLPSGCTPTIITDAGFKAPWFKYVRKLTWNYIGRMRGNSYYNIEGENVWEPCTKLYQKATSTVRRIANVILTKTHKLPCELYVIKNKKKGRISKNKSGKRYKTTMEKRAAKTQRDPWVIATSLPHDQKNINLAIKYYSNRMQIEEGFRDLKSHRLGFGFNDMRSQGVERIQVLLLIGMLGTLYLLIVGLIGKNKKIHYDYQANTIRDRNVLSIFFLGSQLVRDGYKILLYEFNETITNLKTCIHEGVVS